MLHCLFGKRKEFSRPYLLIFQLVYFDHTSNSLVNEICISEIKMHSCVELIKGYMMHYLSLKLDVKNGYDASWRHENFTSKMCIFLRHLARLLWKFNHREFCLLIVSNFQNPLILFERFSRDPLKNPMIFRFWLSQIVVHMELYLPSNSYLPGTSEQRDTNVLSHRHHHSSLTKNRRGRKNSFLFPRRQWSN